ncbi:MAG: mannosyltransferase [Marivirga sp.]|jgi:mannosyltransferase
MKGLSLKRLNLYSERTIWFYLVMVLLIAVSFSIKLFYIDSQSYWLDESYTRWFIGQTYRDLVFWVPTFESHPPLYYILAKSWGIVFGGIAENSERYFSLLLSAFLFIPLYLALRKPHESVRSSALISMTVLICFSDILSWYSIEARPYLLLTLSFSLSILGMLRLINQKKSPVYWVVFTLGCVLTNWSHNLGCILSLGLLITLAFHFIFVEKKIKSLGLLAISALMIFIFSVPLLFMIMQQLKGWSDHSWIPEVNEVRVFNALRELFAFSFYSEKLPYRWSISDLLLRITSSLPSAIVLTYFSWMSVKSLDHERIYLTFNTVFIIAVAMIVTYAGPNVFLDRTLTPVLIPLYLFIAINISKLNSPTAKFIITFYLLISLSYSTIYQFNTKEKEPWNYIISLINENRNSETKVFLFPNYLELAILKNDLDRELTSTAIPLPFKYPAMNRSNFYPGGTPSVPGFTADNIEALIEEIGTSTTRILLLVRSESLYDPELLIRKNIKRSGWSESILYTNGGITLYDYKNRLKRVLVE